MASNDTHSRLELLKQKNIARLMRNDAAGVLSHMAPVLAALCDRFSIHVDTARARELSLYADRFNQLGDWYAKGEVYGYPHHEITRAALSKLISDHGLTGEVEFAALSSKMGVPIIIGVPTESLPDVIPALLAMLSPPDVPYAEIPQLDDCWIVNRADHWGLLLWHEGLIVFERADP